MKTETKKARFLHNTSREYRGLRSVRNLKTLAHRIERRCVKRATASIPEHYMDGEWCVFPGGYR